MRTKPCPFRIETDPGGYGTTSASESSQADSDVWSSAQPSPAPPPLDLYSWNGPAQTCSDYEMIIEYYVGNINNLPRNASERLCEIRNKILYKTPDGRVFALTEDSLFDIGYVPASEARRMYQNPNYDLGQYNAQLRNAEWKATYGSGGSKKDIYQTPDGKIYLFLFSSTNPGKPI